jgi:hypothetical protein
MPAQLFMAIMAAALDGGVPDRSVHPLDLSGCPGMIELRKDATARRHHHDDHARLERRLADVIAACTFGRRLKTLKGLSPFEFIDECRTAEPRRFRFSPLRQMPGSNI